jgi:hypothetical protein
MITGQLATTLVAKRETPSAPWWLLIVAALLIDPAMFTLVGLGIEQMEPAPNAVGPTLSSAIVDMTYSHDLLPQLFWITLSALIACVFTRNAKIVIVAMLLTLGHWLGDLISGYGHFFWPRERRTWDGLVSQELISSARFRSRPWGGLRILVRPRPRVLAPKKDRFVYRVCDDALRFSSILMSTLSLDSSVVSDSKFDSGQKTASRIDSADGYAIFVRAAV